MIGEHYGCMYVILCICQGKERKQKWSLSGMNMSKCGYMILCFSTVGDEEWDKMWTWEMSLPFCYKPASRNMKLAFLICKLLQTNNIPAAIRSFLFSSTCCDKGEAFYSWNRQHHFWLALVVGKGQEYFRTSFLKVKSVSRRSLGELWKKPHYLKNMPTVMFEYAFSEPGSIPKSRINYVCMALYSFNIFAVETRAANSGELE